ncbi:MAG TPA: type VI secretion system baseplate subunit TssE [Bryobacteraceae bacterium]|nr:type VI secretion system baseplate subunit TssE [Bryobacteraceae bacterium]
MARMESDSVVTQSLLERLIDREPDAKLEPAPTRSQSVRLLKASVRRDLEWLLNTRQNPEAAGDEYPELGKSLYNYGLPDFTAMSFDNAKDRTRLLRHLEATIRIFEPRLASPRVIPVHAEDGRSSRIIRFQIEGLLKMDPAPEQVTFDTVLQLSSGEYQIRGERGSA